MQIVLLGIFILAAGLVIFLTYRNFDQKRDVYYALLQGEMSIAYGVTVFENQENARIAFDREINKSEILELYKQANSADEAVRNAIRRQLLIKLKPLYERLKLRDVSQLHFHLPNSESFLRFYRTEKYGDSLKGIRYSVDKANAERVAVSGFEEGRIENGFRNVFPLIYNGEHLGSVEISMNFATFRRRMEQQFHNRYAFMVRRQLVEDSVFADEQKNYHPSDLSDDYLYERNHVADDTLKAINMVLKPKIQERLKSGEGFTFETTTPNVAKLVVFFPVKNVQGQHVAYIVSYNDDTTIRGYYSEFVVTLAISIVGLLAIFVLLYFLINAVQRLRMEKVTLQQERERFNRFMNASPSLTFIKDKNFRYLFVNKQTADFFGKSMDDILGKTDREVAEEEKIAPCPSSDKKVLESDTVLIVEEKLGDRIYEVIKFPLTLPAGEKGIGGIMNDITERKQAEEAVRQLADRRQREADVVANIAISPAMAEGSLSKLAMELTEAASRALGIDRVGVWLFEEGETQLVNVDNYVASNGDHSSGTILQEHEFQSEFTVLKRAKYVDADDPLTDPRTAGYVETYLIPNGITSMLDSVIRAGGKNLGVLCFEYVNQPHHWEHDEIAFACQLADQVALTLENRDRKQAEDKLRQSQQMNQTILKALPDLMFVIDKNYVFRANHASSDKDLYAPPEFFLGKQVDEVLPHELAVLTKENVDKVLRSGEMSVYEYQIELAGTTRFFDARMVFQEENLVLSINRDITERKQAEQQLHNEREKLFVTLRSIGDGVITTDTDGRVTFINSVAEQLTGWNQGEATGQSLSEVFNIINEKTGEPVANPVNKVFTSGKIIGLANHTVLIAKNGIQRNIADSGAPIFDSQGKIIGVVLVFRDVTQTKKREEELLKIKKLESVGVLAGGIAHDFNNILTAILGNINLAGLYIEKENEAHSLLKEAEKASLRAKDLTHQLLTFSKGGTPVRETASIKQVLTDSADFVLRGSNVICRYAIPEDLWLVDIDAGQMSQVIQNLVINARHAMPEGGEIKISCENVSDITTETGLSLPGEKYIKITIADKGYGIPEKYLDKIFDPYFSTKQKGSGLGLAVTNSIINKHDGHITVKSEPGEGTTFTIYMPASTKQISSDSVEETQKPEKTLRGTILVMDDEEGIQDLTKRMLSRFGHEVLQAKDGREAIAIFQEHQGSDKPVDVIIMDLTIPGGMGGKEAIKEILKIDPQAKAIVSSGYSNDPVMANYRQYGFKAAISKPFEIDELKEIINSVLK